MPGPDIWGPHGWKFIHYITLGYPNNPTELDKQKYYDFFMNLSNVIPCPICGEHFKQNLKITPLDDEALKDSLSLISWGVNMHNHVNSRNGKKIYSVNEAITSLLDNNDKCMVDVKEKMEHNNKEDGKINNKKEHFLGESDKTNNNTEMMILSFSICINILLILYIFVKLK